MKKNHKFQPTKHTVKALPMAYAGELDIDEINESVNSNSYVFSVNRAVRRYLAIANNLVSAAAGCNFPSKD